MKFDEINKRIERALCKSFDTDDVFTIWDVRVKARVPGKYWHECIKHIDYLILKGYVEFDGRRLRFVNSKMTNFYRLIKKPSSVEERVDDVSTPFLDEFFDVGSLDAPTKFNELKVSYGAATYSFAYPSKIKTINEYSNAELIAELNRRIA